MVTSGECEVSLALEIANRETSCTMLTSHNYTQTRSRDEVVNVCFHPQIVFVGPFFLQCERRTDEDIRFSLQPLLFCRSPDVLDELELLLHQCTFKDAPKPSTGNFLVDVPLVLYDAFGFYGSRCIVHDQGLEEYVGGLTDKKKPENKLGHIQA